MVKAKRIPTTEKSLTLACGAKGCVSGLKSIPHSFFNVSAPVSVTKASVIKLVPFHPCCWDGKRGEEMSRGWGGGVYREISGASGE